MASDVCMTKQDADAPHACGSARWARPPTQRRVGAAQVGTTVCTALCCADQCMLILGGRRWKKSIPSLPSADRSEETPNYL
ncbi:MAG: hypothetical protein R6U57_04785 [Anaerolineales bacterium]